MKLPEKLSDVTQEICDQIKGDYKHLMICIGYIGIKKCYIDVTIEEAKKRYIETTGEEEEERFDIFGFDDEFDAYEVWSRNV